MAISKLPLATYSISAIIILIFLIVQTNPDYYISIFSFTPASPNLHSVITYALVHVNVFHLLGNVIALLIIGSIMEKFIGHYRVVLIFLVSTLFALPFEILGRVFLNIPFTVPFIGMSGAIFGLLTFSVIIRPNQKIPTWLIFYSFIPLFSLTSIGFLESGIIRISGVVLYLLILYIILVAFRLPKKIPFNYTALVYFLNWVILLLTAPPLPVSFFGHLGGSIGAFTLVLIFYRKKFLKNAL